MDVDEASSALVDLVINHYAGCREIGMSHEDALNEAVAQYLVTGGVYLDSLEPKDIAELALSSGDMTRYLAAIKDDILTSLRREVTQKAAGDIEAWYQSNPDPPAQAAAQ